MAFTWSRLTQGLKKTQINWVARVCEAIGTKQQLDDATLDSLEEALLAGDVGVDVSESLVSSLRSDFALIDGSEQALMHRSRSCLRCARTSP